MKPKHAKEIVNTEVKRQENKKWATPTFKPVEYGLESVYNSNWWQGLQAVIESIEKAGFKVSITKDGKEYNQ